MKCRIIIIALIIVASIYNQGDSQCSVSIIGNLDICLGDGTTLTAEVTNNNTDVTYLWKTGTSSQSATVFPIEDEEFWVTVMYNDTCVVSDTVTVVVNDPVTPIFSFQDSFCLDESPVILPAASDNGIQGTWMPNVISTSDSGISEYTFLPNTNECASTIIKSILIHEIPVISAINQSPWCEGETIKLFGSGGVSYLWDGPNQFSSMDANPMIIDSDLDDIGTYFVIATDIYGCDGESSTIVSIDALISPEFNLQDSFCIGDTPIPLPNQSDNGIQGTWNPASISTSTISVTSYDFTPNVDECSKIYTISIIVSGLPDAIASVANDDICEGEFIKLMGLGGDIYQWNGPNNFSSMQQDTSKPDSKIEDSGLYTLLVTDTNGCTDTDAVSIVVNQKAVPMFSFDNEYCKNDSPNLLPTESINGIEGTWTPETINTSVSGTSSYLFTPSIDECAIVLSVSVEVFEFPEVTVSESADYCVGIDIQLTSTGGENYNWSGPNGFMSNISNPIIENAEVENAGTYYVTVTNVNSCMQTDSTEVSILTEVLPTFSFQDSFCLNEETIELPEISDNGINGTWEPSTIDLFTAGSSNYIFTPESDACAIPNEITITVLGLPNIIASNSGEVCEGNTIDLNSSGGNSYMWTGPNGYISSEEDPNIINSMISDAGTYIVMGIDVNGCSNIDSTLVIVNEKLSPTFSIQDTFCFGDEVFNLPATSENNIVGIWTPSIISTSEIGTSNYMFMPNSNECAVSFILVVTILESPEATATNSGPYCEGETINLNVDGGISYEWSGPTSFTSDGNNPLIENATSNNSGTYSVTVTNSNQCQDIASTQVDVNINPIASISNTGPYCEGDTIMLFSDGGTDYIWEGPDSFSAESQNAKIPNSTLLNDGVYKVIITNEHNCVDSAFTTVTVNDLPVIILSNTGPYCVGETINLNVDGENIDFYDWAGPNDFISSIDNPTIINSNFVNAGVYFVSVTNENNCISSGSISVLINENPSVIISGQPEICKEDFATLVAQGSGGDSNYEYVWSSNDIGPSIEISPPNSTNIMVTVTDGNSCAGVDAFELKVNDLPDINVYFVSSDEEIFLSQGIQFDLFVVIDHEVEIDSILWTFEDPIDTLVIGTNQYVEEIIEWEGDSINGLVHSTGTKVNYEIRVVDIQGCETYKMGTLQFKAKNLCFLQASAPNDNRFCVDDTFDLNIIYTKSTTTGISLDSLNWRILDDNGIEVNDVIIDDGEPLNPNSSNWTPSFSFDQPGLYHLFGTIKENEIIGDYCQCEEFYLQEIEIISKLEINSESIVIKTFANIPIINDSICKNELPLILNFSYIPSDEEASVQLAINGNSQGTTYQSVNGEITIEIADLPAEKWDTITIIGLENLELEDCSNFQPIDIILYVETCECDFQFETSYTQNDFDLLNGLVGNTIERCINEIPITFNSLDFLNSGDKLKLLVINDNSLNPYYSVQELNNLASEYYIFESLTLTYENIKAVLDDVINLGEAIYIYPVIQSGECFRLANSGQEVIFYPNPELQTGFEFDEYCLNEPNARLIITDLNNNKSSDYLLTEIDSIFSDIDFVYRTISEEQEKKDVFISLFKPNFTLDSTIDFDVKVEYRFKNSDHICFDIGSSTVKINSDSTLYNENAFIKWWPGNILASSFQLDSSGIEYLYDWGKNGQGGLGSDWFIIIEETDFSEDGIPKTNDGNQIDYWVDVWTEATKDCPLRLYYNGDGFQPRLDFDENQDPDYSITPNPNNGEFILNVFDQIERIHQFNMFNTQGQMIFTIEGKNLKPSNIVSLESMVPGIYLTSMIFKNGNVKSKKLIIVN